MRTWNGKTFREIMRFSSPAEFFEWMPRTLVDGIAFISLAAFCLFPVIIAIPTLVHRSFDLMILDNMALLDGIIFPMVTFASALAYLLTLGKLRYEKRPALAGIRKSPTLVLFALLLAWMCVNFFFVEPVQGALFHGLFLRHESFSLSLEYYFGFFALGMALRNERMKRWLLRGLTIVSVFLVPCAFYLQNRMSASPLYYDWRPCFSCIFTNPNYYGYFLSVAIGLCAGLLVAEQTRRWRIFHAFALFVNSVILSHNGTRGAWLGALFACVFLVIACRVRDGHFNPWSLIALGLFLLSFGVTTCSASVNLSRARLLAEDVRKVLQDPGSQTTQRAGSWRWLIWSKCLEIIRDNPLFGIGFEGLYIRALDEYAYNTRPHNEFLQYALFYGIPAGILYTAGCVGVYLRAVRRRARLDNVTLAALAAAFGYLVSSFFGVTVYNTAPFLFIMLGLGYVRADAPEIRADAIHANAPAAVSADADALPAPDAVSADADALPAPDAVSADADALPAPDAVSADAGKKTLRLPQIPQEMTSPRRRENLA